MKDPTKLSSLELSSLTGVEAALVLTLLAVVFVFVVFILLLARFSFSIATKGRVPAVICSNECSCVSKEVEGKKSEYVIDMMSQPKLMINDTSRIDSSELEVNVEFPVSDEDNGILELGQTDNSSTETTVPNVNFPCEPCVVQRSVQRGSKRRHVCDRHYWPLHTRSKHQILLSCYAKVPDSRQASIFWENMDTKKSRPNICCGWKAAMEVKLWCKFTTEWRGFEMNYSDIFQGFKTAAFQKEFVDHEVFLACEFISAIVTDNKGKIGSLKLKKELPTVAPNPNAVKSNVSKTTTLKLKDRGLTNDEQNLQPFQHCAPTYPSCYLAIKNPDAEETEWKKLINIPSAQLEPHLFKGSIWFSTNSGERSSKKEMYCLIDHRKQKNIVSKRMTKMVGTKWYCEYKIQGTDERDYALQWNEFIMDKLKELVKNDQTFTINCQYEIIPIIDNNQPSNSGSNEPNDENVVADLTNTTPTTSDFCLVTSLAISDSKTKFDILYTTAKNIRELYLQQEFTDHTIHAIFDKNYRYFNVHKVVFEINSNYFKRIPGINRPFFPAANQAVSILYKDPSIVETVIEFLYRGQLGQLTVDPKELFKLAINFQISKLRAQTFATLSYTITLKTVSAYVILAYDTRDDGLAKRIKKYLRYTDAAYQKQVHQFLNQLRDNSQAP
ncbi:hypothetical protein M3Y96_00991700 [Aphelenchoides besseyi]|nr:hypothetical protein M3Y96_00991700 [Aphelenchoides besseyi]